MLLHAFIQKNNRVMVGHGEDAPTQRKVFKDKAKQQALEEKRAIFLKAYANYKAGGMTRICAIDIAIKGTAHKRKTFQSAWHYYSHHWL